VISQQVWGTLLICFICPILGGLPLVDWVTFLALKKKLSSIGTKNVSVSAAFYHGGRLVGLMAVMAEAAKGILAVLLGRYFFPDDPKWEIFALISLVIGRYWFSQGAGVTNLVWGILVHDWRVALLTFLISGISFTIFRQRQTGRYIALTIFGLMLVLFHVSDSGYILAALFLVSLLWLIYQKIPDDLNLPSQGAQPDSEKVFKFFQGNSSLITLNDPSDPQKVGTKAANLSYLKRLGYPVPDGWVLVGGEDLESLIESFNPKSENPLVVRSSAVGEDSVTSSAAGQYLSLLNITNRSDLLEAIVACSESYNTPAAIKYRQSQGSPDQNIAVIIQKQIKGVYSGVAFSRDPVNPLNDAVIIEALPGNAVKVVSGHYTPQQYQVNLTESRGVGSGELGVGSVSIKCSSSQDTIPHTLIHEVAKLSRELEKLWHGLPQDLEWTYDGQQLWLLQVRTITTLTPIWTRRIAAEVIPGVIRPLTWSINRPLTCSVWGEIFKIVLGESATSDLDFNQTATLHYQQAYFNATLLGEIFRRMGLPPESLDFLTRGAKFSKPPLKSTLKTLPGLFRLLKRELSLGRDWQKDYVRTFARQLTQLKELELDLDGLSPEELLQEIEGILLSLKQVTYYSILAPLSLAIRTAIFKVKPETLDNSQTPEVQAMRSLWNIAQQEDKFDLWLQEYGYLSQVATDIAVPRWKEEPENLKAILNSTRQPPTERSTAGRETEKSVDVKKRAAPTVVQKRLNLKGEVTRIYSQYLAYLRWSFLALESIYLQDGRLSQAGDIFFLEYEDVIQLVKESGFNPSALILDRKEQFKQNQARESIPAVIYGQTQVLSKFSPVDSTDSLQGIPASGGEIEGIIKICRTIQEALNSSNDNILVVPYTDSGWVPFIAQAKGIISEVGGVLSHGAIIAREYGIPAVMDVQNATSLLHNGQKVRLNGYTGWITILHDGEPSSG